MLMEEGRREERVLGVEGMFKVRGGRWRVWKMARGFPEGHGVERFPC